MHFVVTPVSVVTLVTACWAKLGAALSAITNEEKRMAVQSAGPSQMPGNAGRIPAL